MNKQKKDTIPKEESKNDSQPKFMDLVKELKSEYKFYTEKMDAFNKNIPKEGVCFLFSMQALKNWKEYIDWDNLVKNAKINPKYPKKPEKINEDLIKVDKDLLPYPEKDSSCATVLKDGLVRDKDYIIVTQEVWEYFEKKYGGVPIKKSYVKVDKNEIKFTDTYRIFDIVFVYNTYLEQLENQNLNQLRMKKIQLPLDLQLKDFKVLIRKSINKIKLFKYTIDASLLRVWKRDPELDTNEKFRDHLYKACKASRTLDYQISNQGELLDQDDSLLIGNIVKEEEPFIIEINEPGKLWIFFNDRIKAYKKCENCGKMDSSEYTCTCTKVNYCSEKCKYDHKHEHSKKCEKAYDSDDNKEVHKKESSANGVCGLDNLGNTCYMNSALQCLSHCGRLVDYFLTDYYKNEINEKNPLGSKGKIVRKFGFLLKKLWLDDSKSIAPNSFKLAMSKFQTYFHGYTQHDPNEFLIYLLDALHEDLNRIINKPITESPEQDNKTEYQHAKESWEVFRKRNDSVITDIMYGQYKSTIECMACNYTSVNFETFSVCSLPIPNQKEIEVFYINYDYSLKPLRVLFKYPDEKYTLAQLHLDFLALMNKKDKLTEIAIGDIDNFSRVEDLDQDVAEVVSKRLQKSYLLIFEVPEIKDEFVCVGLSTLRREHRNQENKLGVIRMLKLIKNLKNSELYSEILGKYRYIMNTAWDLKGLTNLVSLSNEDAFKEMKKRFDDCFVLYLLKKSDPKDKILIPWDSEVTQLEQDDILQMELVKIPEYFPFETLKGFLRYDAYKHSQVKEIETTERKILNLQDCFQKFREPEELDENNSWYCKKCQKHQIALKKLEIYKAPDVFGIQLKRFKGFDGTRWNRKESKIEDLINFPVNDFDFSPYILNSSSIKEYTNPNYEDGKVEPAMYDLFGVLHHTGTLNNGHCYSHCLHPETNEWYLFNDEKVSKINAVEELLSETAYVLFYKRKGTS